VHDSRLVTIMISCHILLVEYKATGITGLYVVSEFVVKCGADKATFDLLSGAGMLPL
jgi:hypothetical protein